MKHPFGLGRFLIPVLFLASAGACANSNKATPATTATMADSAERVMWGVQHLMVEDGVRQAQLNSDSTFIFDKQNRFELRGQVRMVIFDSVGKPSATLTSREATYDVRKKSMEARGEVVVTTTDGKRLDTQHLVYDQVSDRVRSDSAFRLVEPARQITGAQFNSDPKLQYVSCSGGCRTELTGGGEAIQQQPVQPPRTIIPPPAVKPPDTARVLGMMREPGR